MRIRFIRQRTVPLGGAVSNAAISFDSMTASAVVVGVETPRGLVHGLGFDSYGRYAHGTLLAERLAPRVEAAAGDWLDGKRGHAAAAALRDVVLHNEKAGGHGERAGAVGLLETALWDALAKAEDLPLWALLEREYGHAGDCGPPPGRTAVYASGGHYADNHGDGKGGVAGLRGEAGSAFDAGYGWFKLKVGGASDELDAARLAAAVSISGDPVRVAVDANGAFVGDAGLQSVTRLAETGVRWIEEPTEPLDYAALERVTNSTGAAIATGENLFSCADVVNLLRYAGLRPRHDILQMDIGLSYGITEFVEMVAFAETLGWHRRDFMPHAGHQLALHVCAGLGLGAHETASAANGPFAGVSDDTRIEDGLAILSDAPGAGIERKPALYRYFDGIV